MTCVSMHLIPMCADTFNDKAFYLKWPQIVNKNASMTCVSMHLIPMCAGTFNYMEAQKNEKCASLNCLISLDARYCLILRCCDRPKEKK